MKSATTNKAQQFIDLIFGAMADLTRAGELAAEAIAEDPGFIDAVCDKCPDITPEFVKKLEAIGLRKLHPQLLINESPGVRRLRKMPFALQERYCKEPVPVLIANGETMLIDIRNLQPDQAAQVFSEDGVRSAAAQKAFIEDRAAKACAPAVSAGAPYRIVRDQVVFMTGARMTRKELAGILAQMQ